MNASGFAQKAKKHMEEVSIYLIFKET